MPENDGNIGSLYRMEHPRAGSIILLQTTEGLYHLASGEPVPPIYPVTLISKGMPCPELREDPADEERRLHFDPS